MWEGKGLLFFLALARKCLARGRRGRYYVDWTVCVTSSHTKKKSRELNLMRSHETSKVDGTIRAGNRPGTLLEGLEEKTIYCPWKHCVEWKKAFPPKKKPPPPCSPYRHMMMMERTALAVKIRKAANMWMHHPINIFFPPQPINFHLEMVVDGKIKMEKLTREKGSPS